MYNIFNSFLIRTPGSHFNSLKDESFEMKILNPKFQEAIYLASPDLFNELEKYLAGIITNTHEKQRIESALYRYISRMSSRCTPFGLFAGCSMGHIAGGNHSSVTLEHSQRHTRLDMRFLCTLSQELSKVPGIKENLKYYPNNSLYKVGNKYRYVECIFEKSHKTHQISSINRSVHINAILKISKDGAKMKELLSFLVDRKIEHNTAIGFINELINAQILVNELTPSVTGSDYFERIIHILDNFNTNKSLTSNLKEIQELLYQLDFNQKNNLALYKCIIQRIEELGIPYEEKFLFQVDMTFAVTDATLGKDIVNELQSVMILLNKITPSWKNETLQQFQQAFYNRYENREMPLMEVLDTEIGIGYPVNKSVGYTSPLLDNFYIPNQTNQEKISHSNGFLSVLLEKTMEAVKQDKIEIVINEDDIKNLKTDWKDLPPTIYSMFEILKTDSNGSLIHLTRFSGACAANLLTRFSHTDGNINNFVKEIIAKEQELMPDILLAEIAHLPSIRAGNVLMRPHIRDYEILYLSNSNLSRDKIINMSDLFLSVRQGRLFLRSKKLNKEIVPRLTNAHNYRHETIPVYHFLCDMQQQHERLSLSFSWGYLNDVLTFLPRVRYKKTILSLATWKMNTDNFKYLFSFDDDDQLIDEVNKWREIYKLPKKMLLSDGDNELLVDWEFPLSIRSLFSIVKKREMIWLKEFLFDHDNYFIKDRNGNLYKNECIVAFYKNNTK